jgi:hypothetical protein
MSNAVGSDRIQSVSIKKLSLAALGAVLIAALVFVGAVLPAEYGIDPLGTGDALGLLALAQVVAQEYPNGIAHPLG